MIQDKYIETFLVFPVMLLTKLRYKEEVMLIFGFILLVTEIYFHFYML